MISLIRKALSSWIVLALLGVIIVAFIITGVGDPFGGGGGQRAGVLARVGDSAIGEVEFRNQLDRILQQVRQENPQLTTEAFVSQGGFEQVLDQLIATRALEQFGREEGLAVSQRAVDAEIASIPAFQLAGRFNQATYEQILAAQRISERELRAGLRGDLIRRQLLAPVPAGGQAPESLVTPYAALLLEQRQGQIGAVPAEAVKDVPQPTDEQIEAFYTKNQARYTIPERRAFRYALLSQEAIAADLSISEADIKAYYDAQRDQYQAREERELSQVVVQDQAMAERIAERAQGGEPFAAVAGELAGYSTEDLAAGTLTEAAFAEATNETVANTAFALPEGGVSDPVRSAFGWHVIRADEVMPGETRSLEEVRDEIVAALRTERAEDRLAEMIMAIEEALIGGESMADVAKEYGLELTTLPPMTRQGQIVGDDVGEIDVDPRTSPLLARAFETQPGEEARIEELNDELFALFDVTELVPPTPVPLDEIRETVAADWVRTQQHERAEAMAKAILAEVDKGTSLAAALAKRGLPAPQKVDMRRIDVMRQEQVLPPMAMLFSLPEGAARTLELPQNQGYFVVKVDDVTPGDPAADPETLSAVRQQIERSIAGELTEQFAGAVMEQVGVERNADAIEALREGYLGRNLTEQP